MTTVNVIIFLAIGNSLLVSAYFPKDVGLFRHLALGMGLFLIEMAFLGAFGVVS